jgi:hypothetical protein
MVGVAARAGRRLSRTYVQMADWQAKGAGLTVASLRLARFIGLRNSRPRSETCFR